MPANSIPCWSCALSAPPTGSGITRQPIKVAELEANQAGLPEILNIAAGEKARKMYNEGDLDAGIIVFIINA